MKYSVVKYRVLFLLSTQRLRSCHWRLDWMKLTRVFASEWRYLQWLLSNGGLFDVRRHAAADLGEEIYHQRSVILPFSPLGAFRPHTRHQAPSGARPVIGAGRTAA